MYIIILWNQKKKKIKISTKYIPRIGEIILVQYSKNNFTKAKVIEIKDNYVKVKYIEKQIVEQLGKNAVDYQLNNIKKIDKITYIKESNEIVPEKMGSN